MRILCLDVGKKNIGLAMSDELGISAHSLSVIQRKNIIKDIAELKKIIMDYHVTNIVVGLPINMNGTLGKSAEFILDFVEVLNKETNLPIKTWDERLTSMQAEKILIEADMSRKKRKGIIDKLAAQFILQSYLDTQNKS